MSESPSESGFVNRVNRGTESVAAEVDHRYRQELCRLVEREMNRCLRSREDPEDVVQTVFRTYFRRAALGEFHIKRCSELWALLAKITRRKILKRIEYHQAEKRTWNAEERLVAETRYAREPGAEDAAIAADLMRKILQGLEASYGEVFRLRLRGCTEHEIADQLKCTRAAVRYKMDRLRERLSALSKSDRDE